MKYTVIYQESRMMGSHRNSIVKFERITLNPNETLRECLVRLDLWDFMLFIFEGHPPLEGELVGDDFVTLNNKV